MNEQVDYEVLRYHLEEVLDVVLQGLSEDQLDKIEQDLERYVQVKPS